MLSRILSLSAYLMLLRILPILMTLMEALCARLIVARLSIALGMISFGSAYCDNFATETEANAELPSSCSSASFDSDSMEEVSSDSTFGSILTGFCS